MSTDIYDGWFGPDAPYTDDSFDRFVDVTWEDEQIQVRDADFDGQETVIEL